MRRLFPDITFLHAERNPLFDGIPPEPVLRNLGAFQEVIKLSGDLDCGLATDGDADRIALFDGEGNYIDSHHVLMLLIHYLAGTKGWKGMVGMGFSSSVKVKRLCEHYNIPYVEVMIGFKHLCGVMLEHDVLVGGEESGGIAVKGHIPERDGVWNGMVIWEMMARSGKSLRQLIEEMYTITGPFAFERIDLNIPEGKKNEVVENCKAGRYTAFNGRKVQRVETMDGYKYWLSDHEWVMVRPSGTEPVLRTYAEAATTAEAFAILKDCHTELGV
jgi:phosphomannomutase